MKKVTANFSCGSKESIIPISSMFIFMSEGLLLGKKVDLVTFCCLSNSSEASQTLCHNLHEKVSENGGRGNMFMYITVPVLWEFKRKVVF